MRMLRIAACTLVVLCPLAARAQGAAPTGPSGLKKDIIFQIDDAQSKLLALANAIPAAKFAWRPTPDVRSVSEVLIHVADENMAIPVQAGATASTAKMPADAEKSVTEKAAVIDLLTKSFAYAKQALLAVPDAQMDAASSYFGTPMSRRGIYFALAIHGHEHLGQLIAYARSNNIKPPW